MLVIFQVSTLPTPGAEQEGYLLAPACQGRRVALFQERIVDSAKLLWLVRRGRSKPEVGVSCRDGKAEPCVAQRG